MKKKTVKIITIIGVVVVITTLVFAYYSRPKVDKAVSCEYKRTILTDYDKAEETWTIYADSINYIFMIPNFVFDAEFDFKLLFGGPMVHDWISDRYPIVQKVNNIEALYAILDTEDPRLHNLVKITDPTALFGAHSLLPFVYYSFYELIKYRIMELRVIEGFVKSKIYLSKDLNTINNIVTLYADSINNMIKSDGSIEIPNFIYNKNIDFKLNSLYTTNYCKASFRYLILQKVVNRTALWRLMDLEDTRLQEMPNVDYDIPFWKYSFRQLVSYRATELRAIEKHEKFKKAYAIPVGNSALYKTLVELLYAGSTPNIDTTRRW